LLPKEKQQVEIVRRSKFTRALHEERSVESEFETEFSNTLRTELSASQDFNIHQEAGGGFDFFGLFGASAEVEIDKEFSFDQSVMNETVFKASSKVSSKYDLAIDTKTEVENKFRSLRTIENPNPCKVVTFFFKQLNKKFSLTLSLLSVKFDIVRQVPSIHKSLLGHYTKELNIKRVFEVEPLVFKQNNNLKNIKASVLSQPSLSAVASNDNLPKFEFKAVNSHVELNKKAAILYKELTKDQLVDKLKKMKVSEASIKRILASIKKLLGLPSFKLGEIYKRDYCLRTGSIITEPRVSECSICDCDGCGCDDDNSQVTDLQVEKLKVEIDILKKQLED
jgi:hypothetical protein